MNKPIVDSLYYIVSANMPLVYRIVAHFEKEGIEREKLIKAGLNGLIKAAIRFNLYEKLSFQTFCIPYVIQSVSKVYKEIDESNDGKLRIDKQLILDNKNYENEPRQLIESIISSNYQIMNKLENDLIRNLVGTSKK